MGAIGEDVSVHGAREGPGAPRGDDDWKAQLEASDDEAEPPTAADAANPADVASRAALEHHEAGVAEARVDGPEAGRPFLQRRGLAKRTKTKTTFGALPGGHGGSRPGERRADGAGGGRRGAGGHQRGAAQRAALGGARRRI